MDPDQEVINLENANVENIEEENDNDEVVIIREINNQPRQRQPLLPPDIHAGLQRLRANIMENEDDDEEVELNAEENALIDFIVDNIMQHFLSPEDVYELFNQVHSDFNEYVFNQSKNPLKQPVIMRCVASYLDLNSMKNFRLTCKLLKDLIDPYFYNRSTFAIKDTTEFYQFLKRANTQNHIIPTKMKKIAFSDDIDLFEVSRILYRARSSLLEASVVTTPMKLRGEFQNVAGVLPSMARLHTLRLNLPRRYLLHQLFRAVAPIKSVKTIQFNFENAQPSTISGVFNCCSALKYLEVSEEQLRHMSKLSVAPITLEPSQDGKTTSGLHLYKIRRNPPGDSNDKNNNNRS